MVLALDAAARRAGLRIGMPAAKAQALVPGLILRDADPAADAKALDRLALWALQRYAPIAAADPPDGLIIDVTGAAHLHGGEDVYAERHGQTARFLGPRSAGGDRRQLGRRLCLCPHCGTAHRSSFRRETAQKLFSTCPSPLFVCPKPWWRICPSSALRASANSRQNPARRSPCALVPNLAAVSIRPWDV